MTTTRKLYLAGLGSPSGVYAGANSRWINLATGEVWQKSSSTDALGWSKLTVATPPPNPPTLDTVKPTIVSMFPSHNSLNVLVGVHPVVTFSEPMAPASTQWVSLNKGDGAVIPALVHLSANTITLTPGAPLQPGTTYQVRVANLCTDLAGNPMLEAGLATFVTKAVVVVPPIDPPVPPSAGTLKARLFEDMNTGHEGNLDGVPDGWDWAHNPKHGGGWNNPSDEYGAAVVWGQIYSSATPVEAVVEVSNLKFAILYRSTMRWEVLQSTKADGDLGIDGGYYDSAFTGNTSKPGAGKTATGAVTGTPNPAWNLHIYPDRRTLINNPDIAAVCCWMEARLAPGSDPRARYLAGAGGDFWKDLGNPFPGNTDIAIGKHRYLKPGEWTTVTAHTLSASELDTFPLPPVVLVGSGTVTPPPVEPPPVVPPIVGTWARPRNRVTRVMFMGDSITRMQADSAQGLASLASKLNFGIELVGTEVSNGIRHEGRGAWCLDDTNGRCLHSSGFHAGGMIQNANGWVTTHTPDVVVLNAGSNDRYVVAGFNDQQVAQAVGQVIDVIHAARPSTLVMVTGLKAGGEVSPHGGSDNATLNPLIQAKAAVRANTMYFDAYKAFSSSADFIGEWDIHPSEQGITKMITAVADVLKALPVAP